MTKHTPGPWKSSTQRGAPGHCFCAQVWGPDGKSLAVIDSKPNSGEATANARLMAKSPDMLAILKEAVEQEAPFGPQHPKWFKKAQRIIAAATK